MDFAEPQLPVSLLTGAAAGVIVEFRGPVGMGLLYVGVKTGTAEDGSGLATRRERGRFTTTLAGGVDEEAAEDDDGDATGSMEIGRVGSTAPGVALAMEPLTLDFTDEEEELVLPCPLGRRPLEFCMNADGGACERDEGAGIASAGSPLAEEVADARRCGLG